MKRGRRQKAFIDYIEILNTEGINTLEEYAQSPSKTFLTQAVHLADAINHCVRHFPKKGDDTYTNDSQDSIYRLNAAVLAVLMGHFETYQQFQFSGLFEASRLVSNFDISECCRNLQKESSLSIDVVRISAYRGQPAPIGQLIADNLKGWHDPRKINTYFKSIVKDLDYYSATEINQLLVLWQLRHSIVHTGAWLTHPDSQKHSELNKIGNNPITLNIHFIPAVVRRFHAIVKRTSKALETKFRAKLPGDLNSEEKEEVKNLFKVESPRHTWLG